MEIILDNNIDYHHLNGADLKFQSKGNDLSSKLVPLLIFYIGLTNEIN